ncbi:heavy metal-associated isoprenylated plant protein 4 [Prosopis cineraria]|uniref:heavy metal-associated isoprenylated plant protein 4 n=1 Tax=Prosopis cineraria TaxID=364024 RepID=UPI00240F55AE|nr:heavy metal-associated isoprenylated plant protein 4 [Prosopis cineraria]
MAEGKEEKKEEKGKEKEENKKNDEKKEGSDVINAIYKVNLHCQQCGRKIKKHLLVTQGVQNVETDMEKGEIKVKGKLDPLKILKIIEKKSNKKVELISPKIKAEPPAPPEKIPKEIKKEPIIRTITAKVHMHCDKCGRDLQNRLIKHRGIFSVKTDQEAQTVTTEGSIEPEKLLRFLKTKVHKKAEIISSKEQKKVEDKEKGKQDGKSPESSTKEKGKAGESTKEKREGKSGTESKEKEKEEKKKDGESEKKDKEKEKEEKKKDGESEKDKGKEKNKESGESTTQIIQIQEDTTVDIVAKHNVPYIIHYVYAPQLFSDENPNACCVL